MRRMRTPLIVLILVYCFSTLVMMQVPGLDDAGNPYYLGFLDSAYFVAILQTTIGLGEVPYRFTDAQRLAVYLLLVPNVVAWLYSFATLLSLFLDAQFQAVLHHSRFRRKVNRIREPFYIVCGFGSTGSMTVSGLLARGLQAVVIEKEDEKVRRMALVEEYSHVPALIGPARDRNMLELAGLENDNCMGVIATTNDDHINLTIAITVKLLRPGLVVIARSETQRVCANMASFETDHVVDPYRIFSERFELALSSPTKYLVQDWLISVPGTRLREVLKPPTGHWIVCGGGRFGSRIIEQLQNADLPFTVVDVHPDRLTEVENSVLGRGTEASTLCEAGVETAAGIVAATGDDIDNLSIIMTAHQLNSRLFTIARQETQENDALFDASETQLIARRSHIVTRRILLLVTTPLLQSFLQHLIRSDSGFAKRVASKLERVLDNRSPVIWVTDLSDEIAANIRYALTKTNSVRLEDITLSSRTEMKQPLPCVCLSLERGAQRVFLPGADTELHEGDRLLFAGRDDARQQMSWTLQDTHALLTNITGKELPRGSLWRWLSER